MADNTNNKQTRNGDQPFPDPQIEQGKCRDFILNFTSMYDNTRKYFEQLVNVYTFSKFIIFEIVFTYYLMY